MVHHRTMKSLAALLLLFPTAALAQTADWAKTSTPKILSISNESLRSGYEDAHRKVESGWREAFIKARYPSWFLGLSSLTGPSHMLFLTGFESYAAWQKDDDDQGANAALWTEQDKLSLEDATYVTARSHELLELMRDASVEAKYPFATTRFLAVTRAEVEPAQLGAFREWLSKRVTALPHVAAYRTVAGGSLSSFVVIEARPSRAAFAAARLDWDAPPGVKSMTRDLYNLDPMTSHVSAEMGKGQEKFWFPED